ncbi:hypothetical protein [Leptospira noguchii]|uniref:Uncharacterized protein n=1 Tax=Leptospira noguchii TaxID=28182 RepID=A0AAE9GEC1_9LEPT|nr:hypothetical protein [Leptospira noguchii]UOG30282.1 hypothetical protein MAL06_17130 [Leptospira noguchii]UOG56403.1 hypothetical protein MAL03_16630 [Leptospira noguchii]
MLRSIVSSIEFEKFRRNWSENEQLSVSLLWSLEETQRLASMVARGNSASRFYGRSRKLSVSLLWSLEETQRLASMVARGNSASRFYGRSTGREPF